MFGGPIVHGPKYRFICSYKKREIFELVADFYVTKLLIGSVDTYFDQVGEISFKLLRPGMRSVK